LQGQGRLLIGLSENRGCGLLKDVEPHETRAFIRDVGIADSRFSGSEILARDFQYIDCYVDSALEGSNFTALSCELLAFAFEDREGLAGIRKCFKGEWQERRDSIFG
jgi:hypothetical protein